MVPWLLLVPEKWSGAQRHVQEKWQHTYHGCGWMALTEKQDGMHGLICESNTNMYIFVELLISTCKYPWVFYDPQVLVGIHGFCKNP